MPVSRTLPSLLECTPEELRAELTAMGQRPFRADQILQWIYRKRATCFDDMSNLPKDLREALAERFTVFPSSVLLVKQADDITEKLLIQGEDDRLVETVLIRYPQRGVGLPESRRTLCVSSQVGCAYGCKFCASGLAGFKRNLSAAEIIAQFLHVARLEDNRSDQPAGDRVPLDNVVFMGMGEPLANFDSLARALRILNADWGLHFGARRVTVSTSGLVPEIRRLADLPMQPRLAVSLHGATNEVRREIMPINRKYPLEMLLPAIRDFCKASGRMPTLEFILIKDVNDSLDQARRLAAIARDLHAHVNLIPYNAVEGLEWERPNLPRQKAFARILAHQRVSHTIRKEKGHDIDAACGQLRLQHESADAGRD